MRELRGGGDRFRTRTKFGFSTGNQRVDGWLSPLADRTPRDNEWEAGGDVEIWKRRGSESQEGGSLAAASSSSSRRSGVSGQNAEPACATECDPTAELTPE